MLDLSPEKTLIFRITHVDNVPWLLQNGVHCRNSNQRDPNYREIGNPDLIAKRVHRSIPISPGGTLSDYIPFYFTPYSPMLLNIKTGFQGMRQTPMSEIVILVASLPKLVEHGIRFVFTDRHAYVAAAQISGDLADLPRIDWTILKSRDFKRDPERPDKAERYQAEALIHRLLPVPALLGIACHDAAGKSRLDGEVARNGVSLKVVAKPDWYF